MIKALFWDMDGVFVDTEVLHFQAWQKLLAKYDTTLSLEEYAPLIGESSKENLRYLCEKKHILESQEEMQVLRRSFYEDLRRGGVRVISENVALAREFKKEYPEIEHYAVSSARRRDLDENISIAELGDFFRVTISFEDDPNLKRKPAPDVYMWALKISSCSFEECIAFEDSANGVRAAKNAHIRCVALPTTATYGQDFSFADMVIAPGTSRSARNVLEELHCF